MSLPILLNSLKFESQPSQPMKANLSQPQSFIGITFPANGGQVTVLKHYKTSDRYTVQHGKSRYKMHGACVRMAIVRMQDAEMIEKIQQSQAKETLPAFVLKAVYVSHAFGRFSLRRQYDDKVMYSHSTNTSIEQSFSLAPNIAKSLGFTLV